MITIMRKSGTVKKIKSLSPAETLDFGRICARLVENTAVFALRGELGAGKTTFTKGVIKELGVKKEAVSPAFALLKQYSLSGNWKGWTLYHFDLYRLKSAQDFLNEGFGEIFKEPKSIILIEWPERISDILPKKRIDVFFRHAGDSAKNRIIEIKGL